MKKLFTITAVLLTLTSFGQKSSTLKTPSTVTLSLLDGLDFKNNITFKVVEPTKFDNVYGKTSLDAIKDVLQISNLFLQFEMKNQNSYKPIPSPINKIMLMEFDNKTIASITIVAESQNGYGNKITKEYHCYTDLDGTNFKLSSY
jgi:hypothetical protein